MRRNYQDDQLPPLSDSPAAQPPVATPQPQAPPDASAALGDPDFRAFVAQRARELGAAQQDANERQKWANMANGFSRARAWGNNVSPDQAHIAENNAQAQLPVTQLQQRQGAESKAISDLDVAQQVQERSAKAHMLQDSLNPNSEMSKRARMLAVAQKLIPAGYTGPYSASMHQDMLKGAELEVARDRWAATIKMAGAHLKQGQDRLDEEIRHHKVEEAFQYQKPLQPQQTTELESLISGVKALDDLKGARDTSGAVDKALSLIGVGDYAATKTAAAGEIAKADAKGRVNPTGAAREASLLPGAMTPGGGKQLADRRRHMLDAAEQRIKLLEAGGARPAQVEEYRSQIDALKGGGTPGGGRGGAGTVNVREKATGKVKPLPADQAKSVLADPRFEPG